LALKLYIAYGTDADQVIALRLQALAAVNGLSVYVPPAYTRQPRSALDPQSDARLRESDVIIGVITVAISEVCRQELNAAKASGKKTIVIAKPALASWLEPYFPGDLVVIDPLDPAAAEQAIVEFLTKAEIAQQAKKTLIALGTLALGALVNDYSEVNERRPGKDRRSAQHILSYRP